MGTWIRIIGCEYEQRKVLTVVTDGFAGEIGTISVCG